MIHSTSKDIVNTKEEDYKSSLKKSKSNFSVTKNNVNKHNNSKFQVHVLMRMS